MAANKTLRNDGDVVSFLNGIDNEQKRKDCFRIVELMEEISGSKPEMWGDSIVGFGNFRYKYSSGREGDWFLTGFSPRKQNITLYLMNDFSQFKEILDGMGKYKTAKSCLYIKKLADVDESRIRKLIELSVDNKGLCRTD